MGTDTRTKIRWDRIKRLRNRLAGLKGSKDHKFNMSEFIRILSPELQEVGRTIDMKTLRKNGPDCRKACCLAGETVILFGPRTRRYQFKVIYSEYRRRFFLESQRIEQEAIKLLGLTFGEADWFFQAEWAEGDDCDARFKHATLTRTLKYLDHVLAKKNIYLDWRGNPVGRND